MLQQRSERYVLSDQCRWWSARSLSLSSFCVSRCLVGILRRSVSTNSLPYTLPRGAGAQWEAARPELEPILLQEVDAAVAGAEKPCWRQCVAGLPDRAAAFLGCSQISLFSAKQQLIDKGWLAKVNTVLGRHGLVADLEFQRHSGGPQGGSSEVSHAESLLRVLIDACHTNANPGGSVMLRNDT